MYVIDASSVTGKMKVAPPYGAEKEKVEMVAKVNITSVVDNRKKFIQVDLGTLTKISYVKDQFRAIPVNQAINLLKKLKGECELPTVIFSIDGELNYNEQRALNSLVRKYQVASVFVNGIQKFPNVNGTYFIY